jgi:hypothetical protein
MFDSDSELINEAYNKMSVDKSLGTFVRWGGLSPVIQKGYKQTRGPDATFHSPPTRRGIYAFPIKWIEKFLLGGVDRSHQRPRTFKHYGDIWHHLDVSNDDILKESGAWVKTSFDVWAREFKKELHKNTRSTFHINRLRAGAELEGDFFDLAPFSGDHVEVFIERIQSRRRL